MPLYEYRCQKCGGVFEVIQKFSDEPLTIHEACGGKVERLLSPPALQFKGTGWYVTDYGGKKNGGAGNGKSHDSRKSEVTTPPAATTAKTETKTSEKSK